MSTSSGNSPARGPAADGGAHRRAEARGRRDLAATTAEQWLWSPDRNTWSMALVVEHLNSVARQGLPRNRGDDRAAPRRGSALGRRARVQRFRAVLHPPAQSRSALSSPGAVNLRPATLGGPGCRDQPGLPSGAGSYIGLHPLRRWAGPDPAKDGLARERPAAAHGGRMAGRVGRAQRLPLAAGKGLEEACGLSAERCLNSD